MKHLIVCLSLALGINVSSFSQLEFYEPEVSDGYTLFSALNSFYLIDNCGEIVHEWDGMIHYYHAKLLENGNLMFQQPGTSIANPSKIIEIDWDGNVVVDLPVYFPGVELEYEVIKMSNGNYLSLARLKKDQAYFEELGYDIGNIGFPTQVDIVVGVDGQTGNLVWIWDITDHVIQERADSLNNYGSVYDNPQLLNMDAISTFDWTDTESFMINGMDYNEELDQIILSIRKMSEVVVIDHSTTTEEAAGHTGGNYGKGGDILYRWGNPQNYNRGTEEDRFLFFQHNPNWIKYGDRKGDIVIYDNGLDRPGTDYYTAYSAVPIIELPVDAQGNYTLEEDMAFGPALPVENYSEATGSPNFFSGYTSGAQVLQNGNIHITTGNASTIYELNPAGDLVWQYRVPGAFTYVFRSEKYPLEYPAFEGRDLTPSGTIEDPSSTVDCSGIPSSVKDLSFENISIWLDASFSQLHIEALEESTYQYKIVNVSGQVVFSAEGQGSLQQSLESFAAGIYIVQVVDKKTGKFFNKKIALP